VAEGSKSSDCQLLLLPARLKNPPLPEARLSYPFGLLFLTAPISKI